MKLHNCPRCGYSTNIRSNFKKHLQRKSKCKPKIANVPLDLLNDAYNTFVKQREQFHTPEPEEVSSAVPQLAIATAATATAATDAVATVGTSVASDAPAKGFLYMLREREFIKTNEDIYKVGKTSQPCLYDRLKKYPKNSELLLAIKVPDCHSMETKLLRSLRTKFIPRRDIGLEYFQGDPNDILREFLDQVL